MDKQIVRWNKTKCTTERGTDVNLDMGNLIDNFCRSTLLSQILKMPQKNPIGFDDATRLLDLKLEEVTDYSDQYGWHATNFVEWISSQGFHIVLTGNEFEPWSMQVSPA